VDDAMAVILVVDDTEMERVLLTRVINSAGHEVIVAKDGKECMSLAKEKKPALIFLDIVMPIMDGFATCRQLRQDPATSNIPVVLVTSKATDNDVFWGKKQGAVEHVAKPWTPGIIEMILQKYCPR
jgi:twitching motility two-component system response regulator PilH